MTLITCVHCDQETDIGDTDHWEECPKHPAGEKLALLQAQSSGFLSTIEKMRLRIAALETVEWVIISEGGFEACPWCLRDKEDGHDPDCVRKT